MFRPIIYSLKFIAIIGLIVSCQKNDEPILIPEVSTSDITSILGNTAVSGGYILSDGGADVMSKGVCWSEEENPTIDDFKTVDGRGTGEFTSSMTNLEEFTTYHVRAYATNEAGTSYGEELVFTTLGKSTLTTIEITDLTASSAKSGGRISDDGGLEVIAKGVCWSKDENPTINDFKTEDGPGRSDFNSYITSLAEFTTYYVRSYATNEAGTAYGEELVFTTLGKPILATKTASDLTTSSVISGGIIESDGGAMITLKGICWSDNPSPTIEDQTTENGTGASDFSSTIEGLNRNTTYFMRAYALNEIGISYGEEIECKTFEILDIDGNGYYAIIIGSQTWLTSNLKVTKYRNYDPIPNVTDNNEWGELTEGAYCDYDNNSSNSDIYGRLYNWYAVGDSRNLAPEGWHVASNAEWNEMIDFLGGEDVAGGKLKQTGTSLWQSPNEGASNESGFTALPGGGRGFENVFSNQGIDISWWTSSENQPNTAYGKYVVHITTSSPGYSVGKESGSYVRCIKD